jgi:hypothetical protein
VTTSTTDAISSRATASDAARWGQLIFGIKATGSRTGQGWLLLSRRVTSRMEPT